MDHYELNVLEIIQSHDYISQRDISNQAGISLGMVNMLIKKFIGVGIIKAERLNGKKIKYMLTPSGVNYLSKKTTDFIARSYNAVLKIKDHMKEKLLVHYGEQETVLVYGENDEIKAILIDVLKELHYPYQMVSLSQVEQLVQENQKFVYWKGEDFPSGINILNQ